MKKIMLTIIVALALSILSFALVASADVWDVHGENTEEMPNYKLIVDFETDYDIDHYVNDDDLAEFDVDFYSSAYYLKNLNNLYSMVTWMYHDAYGSGDVTCNCGADTEWIYEEDNGVEILYLDDYTKTTVLWVFYLARQEDEYYCSIERDTITSIKQMQDSSASFSQGPNLYLIREATAS